MNTNGHNRAPVRHRAAVLLGCTAVMAFVPTLGFAQQAEATGNAVVLQQVVVSGGGNGVGGDDDGNSIVAEHTNVGGKIPAAILDTPASVSVVTSKEIEKRDAESVEEVLQYTAGVVTDFYGSDDRFDFFQIRGFDAYTYRDGLTLGRPFGGIREEPYAYERVEVLKGGSSTTFGVSDPGGAVNYVTKTPKRDRFGEVYVTGGSFERKEVGFDFGDNITEDDTLSYRLTGKLKDADLEYEHSRNDDKFIQGGLTWRPDGATNFTVVFDHLHKNGVPGSGGYPNGYDFDRSKDFFGEPGYNFRGTDRNTVSAFFDHDFGNGLSFAANTRYSDADTDFGYAYISSTPTDGSTIAQRAFFGSDVASRQWIGDARLQYDRSFGTVESKTLVGLMHNDQVSDSKSYFGGAPGIDWTNPVYTGRPASVPLYQAQKNDQQTTGLYFQEELTFADKLIASIGLRNDWIDTELTNNLTGRTTSGDFSEFTKRFGLTYKITPELATYASYAESVVPASSLLNDVERGEQYELGVKYQPLAFPGLFTASVYDLRKTNLTVTDPISLLPSSIGEVRVRGVDLEAKAELPQNFSLTAAYSYLDAEITENGTGGNEGNRPQFIPENIASLWLDYTLQGEGKRGDLTVGGGIRYVGSYFLSAVNDSSSDDHVIVDAALNYEIVENTSLQVNVNNIFDEKHVAYGGFGADFYNPGRSFSATLRKTW
ncbi:TonB-dependent siderophore receptor [Tianweitania sp. BSSL-BM11]|uniref:TonB-dependent siderophore receptor n=1 Tax=Tianweitania aestuarii TaxID=2814886 RepID=A0ABS5RW09_9HYPH|nr:TonB-dependent siderophore receptor [Tianweitania aestuarii]MBS9721245.1 TonB-dependent siderophore receptor [Tianweitania aestuarii]